MDHQLERVGVVAPRHLGVRNRMIVARLRCKQPGEPVVAAVDEVEVEVIGQRPPSIGARRSVEQLVHRGDVIVFHLTFDLKTPHGARLPAPLPALLPGWSRPVGPSAWRGVRSSVQTRFPPTCLPGRVGHPPPDLAERRPLPRGRRFVFSRLGEWRAARCARRSEVGAPLRGLPRRCRRARCRRTARRGRLPVRGSGRRCRRWSRVPTTSVRARQPRSDAIGGRND